MDPASGGAGFGGIEGRTWSRQGRTRVKRMHGLDISGYAPILDDDDCRDLARAVFQRAVKDLVGQPLNSLTDNPEAIRDEALTWVREADAGFKFWCAVVGVDWRLVRERLLARAAPRPACRFA